MLFVDYSFPSGFNNDAHIFALNMPFGSTLVAKATVDGSDITDGAEISYTVFDIASEGGRVDIPEETPEGAYQTTITVHPGIGDVFYAPGRIKIWWRPMGE